MYFFESMFESQFDMVSECSGEKRNKDMGIQTFFILLPPTWRWILGYYLLCNRQCVKHLSKNSQHVLSSYELLGNFKFYID